MRGHMCLMFSDGERMIIRDAMELADDITRELAFGHDVKLWSMLDALVHVVARCFDGTGEVDVRTVQCVYAGVKHEYHERWREGPGHKEAKE